MFVYFIWHELYLIKYLAVYLDSLFDFKIAMANDWKCRNVIFQKSFQAENPQFEEGFALHLMRVKVRISGRKVVHGRRKTTHKHTIVRPLRCSPRHVQNPKKKTKMIKIEISRRAVPQLRRE